uniref:Uncharacterized protein n=1 Tax=Panagrolaimus superbus TaxID=310955 RepID=A0A914ZB33_9BILA
MQNLDLNLTLVFDPKVMELLNENNHDDAIFDTEKVEQHSSAENQNENFPTLENQSELTIDEEFIAEIADDVVSNVSSDKVVSTENDETPDSEPHSQKNSNDTESNENTVTFEYDIPIDISNVLIEIPSQKNSLDTVSNVFKNLRLFPSIFSSIH